MIPELERSLNKALGLQGWLYERRFNQWGNPFSWVDGPLTVRPTSSQAQHLLGWASSYYKTCAPLDFINQDDYESTIEDLSKTFWSIIKILSPHMVFSDEKWKQYIYGLAATRAQDIYILKNFGYDVKANNNMRHLDFGPGMGVHAVWNSVVCPTSIYTGVEIDPQNYMLQRSVFSTLAAIHGRNYFDALAAEEVIEENRIIGYMNSTEQKSIKHTPSWHLHRIEDGSQDLITATTVLNEIDFPAIGYFVSEANRLCKVGGCIYIRDSGKCKPGRHQVNYERIFEELGFERFDNLTGLKHIVDIHGLPRIWKKASNNNISFDELMEKYLGSTAILVQGASLAQNVEQDFLR